MKLINSKNIYLLAFLFVLQLALLGLKLSDIISWPWLAILAPIELYAAMLIIGFLALVIGIYMQESINKKNYKNHN